MIIATENTEPGLERTDATRWIQPFVDLARMPNPRRILHDLRDTVSRTTRFVRWRAKELDVDIVEAFPDVPAPIYGDPDQLYLAFTNLLQNGLDAMPTGGTLSVSLSNEDPIPDCLRVEISDTGVGIPRELTGRLFEPFVTGKDFASGLGLTVSRRIVREHGGIISAENRAGGGALFIVELPSGAPMPPSACEWHDPASTAWPL